MKMISSTSITSTNGVTLISCMGVCLRARLRRPPPGLAGGWTLAAMGSILRSQVLTSIWRDTMAENSSAKASSRWLRREESAANLL